MEYAAVARSAAEAMRGGLVREREEGRMGSGLSFTGHYRVECCSAPCLSPLWCVFAAVSLRVCVNVREEKREKARQRAEGLALSGWANPAQTPDKWLSTQPLTLGWAGPSPLLPAGSPPHASPDTLSADRMR